MAQKASPYHRLVASAEIAAGAVGTAGAAVPTTPIVIAGSDGTNTRTLSVNADGELNVNLETADIEIGAVEIKNADTDDRVNVADANTERTTGTHVLAVQHVDAAGGVMAAADLTAVKDAAGTTADAKADVDGSGTLAAHLRRIGFEADRGADQVGAADDALVAAGAVGTVSSKLRRLTTDLDAMRDAQTAVGDGTGDAPGVMLAGIETAVETIDNFISGARGLVTEDNSASIKTAVELIDDAVGTIDTAFSGKVLVQGGKAESGTPTKVADADAVALWANTFGALVLAGYDVSANGTRVFQDAAPLRRSSDVYTLLDAVSSTRTSFAVDLTGYNSALIWVESAGSDGGVNATLQVNRAVEAGDTGAPFGTALTLNEAGQRSTDLTGIMPGLVSVTLTRTTGTFTVKMKAQA